MSETLSVFHGKQRDTRKRPIIPVGDLRLENLTKDRHEECADLHARQWGAVGVPTSFKEALEKMEEVDPDDVFVWIQETNDRVQAILMTLPLEANTIKNIFEQIPTQEDVDRIARQKEKPNNPNIRVCYSIVSSGARVELEPGNNISMPKYVLVHELAEDELQKVAYSRFAGMENGDLSFPEACRSLPGATGMHNKFEALLAGVAFHANEKDSPSNGMRTFMIYPKDARQVLEFRRRKADRCQMSDVSPDGLEDAVDRLELVVPFFENLRNCFIYRDALDIQLATPNQK